MYRKHLNLSERAEQYISPEISLYDIVNEPFLCASGDNDDDEGDGDAELPQPGGWL